MSFPHKQPHFSEKEIAQRRKSLIAQIERDFADVSRNGGVSRLEANVIDDYGTDLDRAQARRRDTDTHWTEVRVEPDPTGLGNPFSFLDPIGFRYYFPAYMCFSIRHGLYTDPEYLPSDAHGCLHFHCTPRPGWEDYLESKFALFTPDQRRCVARYLVFELEVNANGCPVDQSDAIEALQKRWLRELPSGEQAKLRARWPALNES